MLKEIKKEILKHSNKKRAKTNLRFFKTGKGEYGEGDKFLGVPCDDMREIAKKYQNISLADLKLLIKSELHEERQIALFILVIKYSKIKDEKIVNFYLKNRKYINNWDLVDCSADKMLGEHLLNKKKELLYTFANSKNLWEKRIAIISTFQLIKNDEFEDTFKIAKILLNDKHDLIHKAVGWMLREIGKKNQTIEEKFLKQHYKKMPRTMLRYAIEKFNEEKRQKYLKGEI